MIARTVVDEGPEVVTESAEFGLEGQKGPGVADGSFYFGAVADDAGVEEETFEVGVVKEGDGGGIEVGKEAAIVLAFMENGFPAEASLGAFEDEKLEHHGVVMNWHAPFGVVIGNVERVV